MLERYEVGRPLDSFAVPALTRVALARFSGALDDYNPIYLDDRVAVAHGKASVFAPGSLIVSYMSRLCAFNFTPAFSLYTLNVRMMKLVWPGDVLTCRGMVVEKREENDD